MDAAAFALFGALDAACLCAVCAGVCAAVACTAPPAEASASARAVRINLLCGDYVEACYPYLDRSRLAHASAFAGAALAGSIIVGAGARSSAYLPLPIAVAVAADRWMAMAAACVVAFLVPLAGTLLAACTGELALPELDPFGYKERLRREGGRK